MFWLEDKQDSIGWVILYINKNHYSSSKWKSLRKLRFVEAISLNIPKLSEYSTSPLIYDSLIVSTQHRVYS